MGHKANNRIRIPDPETTFTILIQALFHIYIII